MLLISRPTSYVIYLHSYYTLNTVKLQVLFVSVSILAISCEIAIPFIREETSMLFANGQNKDLGTSCHSVA